ncbi:putative bifunctional diguanylate cyclase/phosphodiesterase [Paenibacillus roseus]|uniref:putative bifunctional diguanylate cyclase/phosphodiesterase n=1 Tax=Paenibacillus roseus TaxID=2798579 RepID=UPI002FCE1205
MPVTEIASRDGRRAVYRLSPRAVWMAVIGIGTAVAGWIIFADYLLSPLYAKGVSVAVCIGGFIGMIVLLKQQYSRGSCQIHTSDLSAQIAQSISTYSPFPMAVLDRAGRLVTINDAASQLLGYRRGELMGEDFFILLDQGNHQLLDKLELVMHGAMQQGLTTMIHKTGYPLEVQLILLPLFEGDTVTGLLAIVQDVSDRKRNNERIRYMAYYDDMTGLPNRRMFMMHFNEMLEKPGDQFIGMLYLDIDQFKLINDSFGREFGDMLLLQVAERFTRGLLGEDMGARMEGDEFAIMFVSLQSEEELVEKARALLMTLEEPFEMQGFPFHVTASIGMATNRKDRDAGSIIKKADMALGRVKEQGRNDILLYSEEWNNSSLERLTLQHELRQGIQRNEFFLHYQPQYHLSTGTIVGLEALVRWRHPERGLVNPGQFIPLAEESGMIVQLGEWVLEEACRQNKCWQNEGLPAVPVSVNLSIRQFTQQNLTDKIATVLQKTGLSPKYLELEITETMTMDMQHATQSLLELTRLGVGISIDDFGTGYSSLSYLKNLPISRLKIDRSFVRDIQQDPNDAAIVAAIIAMAHNLNLQVIAEGVETAEQLAFLKQHCCDEIQGYFWSPPLPGDQVARILASNADKSFIS